jgi:ABC-type sugar transport system ATPase subunit
MATVTFDHVFKKYGDVTAVSDLNLEIGDGEFMVLVGPSGCGKTTSLRMIAGLEEISDGTLRIGDRVVNDVAPKDRDIAMVFQSYALYPHMTVRDNLAFSASRSAGPSSASPPCSSWTSRCPTSTPSCASRRAPRSPASTSASGPRWSTSRTTRSRP